MVAVTRHGCNQMWLSLRHKDTLGTEQLIPHQALFDVPYFNSLYPDLPIRFVLCDTAWDNATRTQCQNATIMSEGQSHMFGLYVRYRRLTGKGGLALPGQRHPVDLAIVKGAFRPHPWLRAIIQKLLQDKFQTTNVTDKFFTLHARVEPEMLRHQPCWQYKEMNLTKIFQMLEDTFPEPPAPYMFLPINRDNMEKEGDPNHPKMAEFNNMTNFIAVENLETLNRAVRHGLWGGRVQVFEFGSHSLVGTRYQQRAAIVGGLVNFYIALQSKVFIGTQISTYSMELMTQRFYQGNLENFKYLPTGIERWTSETTTTLETFSC
jgi:hypothetical protein